VIPLDPPAFILDQERTSALWILTICVIPDIFMKKIRMLAHPVWPELFHWVRSVFPARKDLLRMCQPLHPLQIVNHVLLASTLSLLVRQVVAFAQSATRLGASLHHLRRHSQSPTTQQYSIKMEIL